jgi:hypothetical protein
MSGVGRRERACARLSTLSAAAVLLFSSQAGADGWTGGGGFFFGYAFGATAKGFEWGFEGYAANVTARDSCSGGDRAAVGPLLQFAFVGRDAQRMSLAVMGAKESESAGVAISGELGAALRLAGPRGIGVHLGVVPHAFWLNTYLRYEPVFNDGSVGGGLRVPTLFAPTECEVVVGRPWRDENGSVVELQDVDAPPPACTQDRREQAGREWFCDAGYEAASVPAFLTLAAELLHAGAPLVLVERALDAASDEIRHAFSCAALASHYLGTPVQPRLPSLASRPPLVGHAALERLAVESFWDGCSSEAAAARVAARAAELASDPLARRAQRAIARDEHRHAELGFDVLRWALSARDPVVVNAVREQLGCAPRVPNSTAPGIEEFGRVSGRVVADEHRQAHATARARVTKLLDVA